MVENFDEVFIGRESLVNRKRDPVLTGHCIYACDPRAYGRLDDRLAVARTVELPVEIQDKLQGKTAIHEEDLGYVYGEFAACHIEYEWDQILLYKLTE